MHQYIYEIVDKNIKYDRFVLNYNKDLLKINKLTIQKIFVMLLGLLRYSVEIRHYDAIIMTHSFRLFPFLKDSLFMLITLFFRKKLILYAQGLNFNLFYEELDVIFKKYIDFIFERVNYFVTVGINQMEEYKKWTNNNINYIHNFIKVDDYHVVKENSNRFRILFLSTLVKSKGIFTFFNAIDILEREENNYQYIICGSFLQKNKEDRNNIEKFIKKHKDKVLLKGRVDGYQKTEVFTNADLFVFPTMNDSFGLVNLEAMHYGLPIITTRQGAIKEYFLDHKNGFFINENDAVDLARKIIKIASNKSLREKISNFNKIYVKKNFNSKIFSDRWGSIIMEVV